MFADWIVSGAALLIGLVFFAITFSFPMQRADPGGMALFPRTLSVIAVTCAVIVLTRLVRGNWKKLQHPFAAVTRLLSSFRRPGEETMLRGRVVKVFILTLAYPFVMVRGGFLLSTVVYVFGLMKVLHAATLKSIVWSLIASVTIYFVFVFLLEASVPIGSWMDSAFH